MTLLTRLLAALLVCAFFAQPVVAADINQSTWSETDSANTSSSPNGWPAGTFPNQVEPIGRATMGALKRFYDHVNATVTSGGSANAQTLSYSVAPTAYVAGDTYTFSVGSGLTNTGAATLNVNSLGAVTVQRNGNALAGAELLSGNFATVIYDGTHFQLQGDGPAATTWVQGNQTPSAGVAMKIDNLFQSGAYPLVNEAGIWSPNTYTYFGIAQTMTNSTVPSAGGGPLSTLFLFANNNGSPGDVTPLEASCVARTSSGACFGANLIVRSGGGSLTNVKLKGLEIDIEPASGDTVDSTSFGLALNPFTTSIPIALQIGPGLGGGSFVNGVLVGGVTGADFGPQSGSTPTSVLDTSPATSCSLDCIVLGNTQGVQWKVTSGNPARMYVDASDFTRIVPANNTLLFRNNSDSTSLATLDTSGNFGAVGGLFGATLRLNGSLLTLATGELGLGKIAASGSAPGASGGKIALVCGTTSGTAKLISYAGTSTTPTTILDNIGGGVSGC